MVTVSYTRRPAIRADRDCTFVAGDADMIFGEKFGRFIYFENLGSTLSPVFVQKSGDDNPFDGIDVGSYSAPALADLDNDGDLDLVAGDGDGMLHFLENTGTSTAPVFVQRTGSENPFDGVSSYSKPALADLDNDGDLDLVVGGGYFENTGTSTAPEFVQRMGSDNPFDGIGSGALADLDGDGDLDLVKEGSYFENVGSARVPRFMQRFEDLNPLNGIDYLYLHPAALLDLDGDGTLKVLRP